MPKSKNNHALTLPANLAGIAGEYYVAAELSRRGFIASLTLRNTRGIDLLATNTDATRTVSIQCKTNQRARKVWVLNEKSEQFFSANHFYVFVVLGEINERPSFHIVPSTVVAQVVAEDHRRWLSRPGKKGQSHVDNPVRNFSDLGDQYLERWELLGLSKPESSD